MTHLSVEIGFHGHDLSTLTEVQDDAGQEVADLRIEPHQITLSWDDDDDWRDTHFSYLLHGGRGWWVVAGGRRFTQVGEQDHAAMAGGRVGSQVGGGT